MKQLSIALVIVFIASMIFMGMIISKYLFNPILNLIKSAEKATKGVKYLAKASEISVVISGKTKKLQTNMEAADFGLSTYGADNKKVLEEVFKDEDCIGLHVDNSMVYPITCKSGTKPAGYKANGLVIPRDFIITGTNNNAEKGGFYARGLLFFTQNSLVLHKLKIINI